jgi:spermidine/putrescine transport system permease protein
VNLGDQETGGATASPRGGGSGPWSLGLGRLPLRDPALIAPGIVAGGLLAFSLSIDDYVVSAFNAGIGSTTLPLYIYSAIKFGVSPEINAISTIVVAITALSIIVAWRLGTFTGEGEGAVTGSAR